MFFLKIFAKKFGSIKNVRTFAIPNEKKAEFWCKSRAMKARLHCRGAAQKPGNFEEICGNSSVGRA